MNEKIEFMDLPDIEPIDFFEKQLETVEEYISKQIREREMMIKELEEELKKLKKFLKEIEELKKRNDKNELEKNS